MPLTPGELFVLTNKLGEFRRLYRWKPAGALVPVTPEMAMDVAGFNLDQAKTRLYLSLNDRGYQRVQRPRRPDAGRNQGARAC